MKSSIHIQNLKCDGCAHTITTKLKELSSISNINVNVNEHKVIFNYTNEIDAIRVKEKLKKLGYPSIEKTNSLAMKAKSFVSCASGKLSK